MSDEPSPTPAQKWKERLYAVIALSVVVMFLGCSGLITMLDFPFHLAVGWIWHLVKTIPALLPQWHKLLLPLGCLALATWLAHRFIRWSLAAKSSVIDWRVHHTLSGTLLVLSGSAAAIALSGVVHQAIWLADAPWWTNRGMFMERSDASGKIRQLHLAILEFENEHGRYPDSLAEHDIKERKLLYQSPSAGEPPEPILYLKPRVAPMENTDQLETAILVSPLLGSGREWVVVGFTSGTTKSLLQQQLPGILETRREPTAKGDE